MPLSSFHIVVVVVVVVIVVVEIVVMIMVSDNDLQHEPPPPLGVVAINAFIIPPISKSFNLLRPYKSYQLQQQQQQKHRGMIQLYGNKPQRLEDNVDGVVYVNDRCINCAACAGFASSIFGPSYSQNHDTTAHFHIVHQQPQTINDIIMTRAALAACPVAAIRIESFAERNHKNAITRRNIKSNDRTTVHKGQSDATTATMLVNWSDHDTWTIQQMTSKQIERPFPRPFLLNETIQEIKEQQSTAVPNVYWIGHHNEASFGAIPYLVRAEFNNKMVWIMIDTPKYNTQSIRDITSITGPNGPHYLFMTHVDDTADHEKWAQHFNSNNRININNNNSNDTNGHSHQQQLYCQRIFHAGDLGKYNWIGDTSLEHVPILIPTHPSIVNANNNNNNPTLQQQQQHDLIAYTLNGTCISDIHEDWLEQFEAGVLNTDVLILYTPGHSPGSCTIYKRRRTIISNTTTTTTTSPGILFTGDTYAYSGMNQRMTGFPKYGRNMIQLNHTLELLITKLNAWDIIAPGHGLTRDYRNVSHAIRIQELKEAQQDLFTYRR